MTDRQSEQLLPCPFCGAVAELSCDHESWASATERVECTKCGANVGPFEKSESAIENWNTRQALAHASSASAEECSVDAKDAARYRYVRSSCGEFVQYAGGGTHHLLEDEELDRAIDQAIAGRRGDGNG